MIKTSSFSPLVAIIFLLAPTSAPAQSSTSPGLATPSPNAAITAPVETDQRLQSQGPPWRFVRTTVEVPSRPRVLLVGDSILNGYLPYATKALAGQAYVDAWVNPYYHSERFNQSLAQVLTNGPYAAVHINLGLHGWQKGRIPPDQFEPLTRALINVIREKCPAARIIWATTTPIKTKSKPCKLDSELNPIIVEENRIAKRVMAETHVQVDDLYAAIVDHLNLSAGDPFHWHSAGSQILATNVVQSILAALLKTGTPTQPSEKPEPAGGRSAAVSGPEKAIDGGRVAGFSDAGTFGFSPAASGMENTHALQQAVDQGGTIVVSRPGIYPIAGTVYIGSDTTLAFGNDVFLKKVAEPSLFSHVLLNKGALTRSYDHHIAVTGLQIIVNGVDARTFKDVYGLHGQLAFFYVKDLRVEHFRCLDLGPAQYGIQVCTFEDILIDDVVIRGQKDGVHLGRGKRFTIRDGVFATGDDAVALNGHDYATGNPELGWIEDGLVENCHDLAEAKNVGYFCRILAGAWIDWRRDMEVQQSDTVVSDGRLYRVQMNPDGKVYKSHTRPTFKSGSEVLDGIRWGVVQTNVTYTAGVRNVTFRDIFLEKPRTAFSIHFDIGRYSRSYYPGAEIPLQQQLVFDNIRVLYDQARDFLSIGTPVDGVSIRNSSLRNNSIRFRGNGAMKDYLETEVSLVGCVFNHAGPWDVLVNTVTNKVVRFSTSGSMVLSKAFSANVAMGGGKIILQSDLPGLK